jgi:hypothetical protein
MIWIWNAVEMLLEQKYEKKRSSPSLPTGENDLKMFKGSQMLQQRHKGIARESDRVWLAVEKG